VPMAAWVSEAQAQAQAPRSAATPAVLSWIGFEARSAIEVRFSRCWTGRAARARRVRSAPFAIRPDRLAVLVRLIRLVRERALAVAPRVAAQHGGAALVSIIPRAAAAGVGARQSAGPRSATVQPIAGDPGNSSQVRRTRSAPARASIVTRRWTGRRGPAATGVSCSVGAATARAITTRPGVRITGTPCARRRDPSRPPSDRGSGKWIAPARG
jgi:hypothetical protein